MTSLPPPSENDVITLADWLEARTLLADDGSSSAADLTQSRVGLEGDNEALTASVFVELAARDFECGGRYAFEVSGRLIRRKEEAASWAYRFCLLASVLRLENPLNNNVARMFESVSAEAAGQYIGGEAMVFGAPNAGLKDALTALVSKVGEGALSTVDVNKKRTGDEKLDVIAWKHHSDTDRRHGFVSLWGQCAAGRNWADKLHELDVDSFQNIFFSTRISVKPVRAFFSPRRLSGEWRHNTERGGLLFDRCRIALHSKLVPQPSIDAWMTSLLKEALGGRTIWHDPPPVRRRAATTKKKR